ncbi:MCM domain-containing protein 2-like isoform X3 [Limulus polyphemus]|uniref:MCM domain-containing protein 2-like isoform X3 n=1 Tax=Limulus polyphemus TaxID=6850 RepID=A0ABM1T4U5_LIMPO|nr:MCM domain-containing protein 2-like isoform X3 [Limulus polyphemus]
MTSMRFRNSELLMMGEDYSTKHSFSNLNSMSEVFCEKNFDLPNTSEHPSNNTCGSVNTNDLYEATICYLDKINYFEKMRRECDIYWSGNSNAFEGVDRPDCACTLQEISLKSVDSNARVFRFGVNVFVQDLMEENAPLCDIVLHQPVRAREIFKSVVYIALKSLQIMPETFTCNQLLVDIKIDWLPPFSEYTIYNGIKLTNKMNEKRFVKFEGIVQLLSGPTKYTQSARYQCSLEDCEGYQGNKFVRVHIPGAWETETIRKDFLCLYCQSPLVEDPTCRILGDKVIAEMIPSSAFYTSTYSVCHQSITVYCRDELTENILLGRKYSVIGIPFTRKIGSSIFVLMEANNMELIENVPYNVPSSIHNLPPPLMELYNAGTLLLATDGVCFLGDLSFSSKNKQEILVRALESGNIIISPPPQVNCVGDLPLLTYPLQCTVWGLISSNSRKKSDTGRKQVEQTSVGLGNLNKVLINGFGMLYITDSTVPNGDEYYNQLTLCQISDKSSTSSFSNILMSNEEWKKFLTYASSINTRFTEEAEFLIQGYYVASRRVHSSAAQGPEFPMAVVSTLMSVAQAFSKLSLRQKVADSDAVMAILLYEETLSARYGYSALNVRNMPHARNENMSYLFGLENDQRLQQFHRLLQQFIATYAGDAGFKEE